MVTLSEKLAAKRSGEVPGNKIPAMEQGANCKACPYRTNPIVYPHIPDETTNAIVGIAPHTHEIREGKPFVGPSGKVLDKALDEVGMDREDFLITNICLCKPTGTTAVTQEAIDCCLPRLQQEIAINNIETVISLGADPLKTLSSESKPKFSHHLNTVISSIWEDVDLIPTYHPAYTLRGNPAAFNDIVNGFKQLDKRHGIEKPEIDIVLIDSYEKLIQFVDLYNRDYQDSVAVIDLETSNKDMERSTPDKWYEGYILALGMCFDGKLAYVLTENVVNDLETPTLLKPILERKIGWVGHNIKFDIKYLMYYYDFDLDMRIADDTMLMSYILDERPGYHSLKKLAGLLGDANYDDKLDTYLKNKNQSYSVIPKDVLHEYLAKDVAYTWLLLHILKQRLEDQGLYEYPYKGVLLKSLDVLLWSEIGGLYINEERYSEAVSAISGQVEKHKQTMRELSNSLELNPNSVPQLNKILYEVLNLGTRRIRKGTSRDVIEGLLSEHSGNEFLLALLNYRTANKLLTSYLNKFPDNVDENGQFHADYNLIGTVTGRLAGGRIMTIPRSYTDHGKLVRNCFAAPSHGQTLPPFMESGEYVIIDADYSQAELRWLGFLSGDEFLYNVYQQGLDLHSETARMIYGEEYTKEQRTHAKTLNFAYAYGGNEYTLTSTGKMPLSEARFVVKEHKKNLLGAEQWKKDLWKELKSKGYVESVLGRRRRFEFIPQGKKDEVHRQVCNFPVQSVASDVTLLAFSKLHSMFLERSIYVYPALFLHDGVYFLARNTNSDFINNISEGIRHIMIEVASEMQELARSRFKNLSDRPEMPFEVDVTVSKFWGN